MGLRYARRITLMNDLKYYKSLFKNRDVKRIEHYSTPVLEYPDEEEEALLDTIQHVWTLGDRYYKLADKYYGESEHWWIIAWYNQRPTEAHLSFGDVIEIPFPLERVLQYYGV